MRLNFSKTALSVTLLVLALGAALLVAPMTGAADEIHNQTYEITDSTEELTVEANWSSTAGTDGAYAEVEVTDENGTLVDNTTMQAEDGNITSHTFNTTDYSAGNYTVKVYEYDGSGNASATYLNGVDVVLSGSSGALGGFFGGYSNAELGLGAVVVGLIGYVLLKEE